MATRLVFSDNDSDMECYLNSEEKVFIKIQRPNEPIEHSGFITLEKEDVQELIKVLTKLESEMR